jgi:SAM-dependent methyltransferase
MPDFLKILQRKCPICCSAYGAVLGRLTFALFDDCPMSKEFDVVACQECFFVFYDTPDSAEQYAVFYNKHYFSSSYTSGPQISSVDAILSVMNDPLAILRPWLKPESKICEIGCGRGTLLAKMKKAGFPHVYGVEPSHDCVEFVKKNLGIEAKVGTADNIPFDDKFDIIVSTHVLEHVVNLGEVAESIFSKLSDDGLVYIEVPDLEGYDSLEEASPLDYITFYEHINHFTISSLNNLLKRYKFGLLEYGLKTLNKGTRLPLPALYGVFRKNWLGGKIELTFNESYDIGKISNWLSTFEFQKNEKLKELAESKTPVYVWGINFPIQKLLSMSSLQECNIVGLLDRDILKQKKTINGIQIKSPETLKTADDCSVVIIWGGPYRELIEQDVHGIGFKGEIIVL